MAQQTSEKLRLPLMLLAAVAIVGFMWWLNVYTEPTQFALAQEEGEEVDEAPLLALETFGQRYTEMEGQRVRLEGLEVAANLGPQAFLTALPDGTPLVVRVLPGAADAPVLGGDVLNLTGTVQAMSETVLDAWEAEGVYTDPTARDIAGFGSHFLEADLIRHDAMAGAEADTTTPEEGDGEG
jgi:hypothetical protein